MPQLHGTSYRKLVEACYHGPRISIGSTGLPHRWVTCYIYKRASHHICVVLILECNKESIFSPMAGTFPDNSDIGLSKISVSRFFAMTSLHKGLTLNQNSKRRKRSESFSSSFNIPCTTNRFLRVSIGVMEIERRREGWSWILGLRKRACIWDARNR